jgi:hypothetical protein
MRSILVFMSFTIVAGHALAQQQVLTYHYDNQRTGWNQNETILTPANVPGLQLLASVPLDDEVDAQPLVYNGIVYVVTENNSVYAIDTLGNILTQTNLGPPIVNVKIAFGNLGINSTPVIDPTSSTLYVISYFDANNDTNNQLPTYQLHALDTNSLTDKVPPVTVSASGRLTNGSIYQFDASLTQQRPAILLSTNGNIYAGFGSFYDFNAAVSRGWLLGWQGGSLIPLPNNYLANKLASDIDDFFLTSIWMSGAGIAEDGSANLFFSTGNSGPSGDDYRPRSNLSESVIQLSPDLATVESYFTPYGGVLGGHYMEQNDLDMSSGGVLVLPDGYVIAAAKTGEMYLLQQGSLGGNAPTNYVARTVIGPCWCTESYYVGPDGVGRIVSSGGNQTIQVWLEPSLMMESQSSPINGYNGFFTSVSSSGTQNPVVWAVDRPADTNYELTLWAYDPSQSAMLGSWPAGTWPNSPSLNSNTVPVVANGQVYVASYQQLAIFGVGSSDPPTPRPAVQIAHPAFKNPIQLGNGEHDVFGTITAIDGSTITVKKRDGTMVSVDTTDATAAPLTLDEPVRVFGSGTDTALHAKWVSRAKGPSKIWSDDR